MKLTLHDRYTLLALAIVVALVAWPIISLSGLYLSDPLYPHTDFAANHLLVLEAKDFNLLHGHYSRYGFHHPGPFFLYWSALFEVLFFDLIPVFGSAHAAHNISATALMGLALAGHFLVWARLRRSLGQGLLALCLMMACLKTYEPSYLVAAWAPVMAEASMLIFLSGLIGVCMLGINWLPWLLFGLGQLLHGHVVFLGIMPLFAVLFLVTYGWRTSWVTIASLPRGGSPALYASCCLLIALFVLPVLVQTLLYWPGNLGLYVQHIMAGSSARLEFVEGLRYLLSYAVLSSLALVFVLPAVRRQVASSDAGTGKMAAFLVALAVAAYGVFAVYVLLVLDSTDHRYLSNWFIPLAVTFSIAAAIYAIAASSRYLSVAISLALLSVSLPIVVRTIPLMMYNFLEGPRLEIFYEEMQALAKSRGQRLVLEIDRRYQYGDVRSQALTFLVKMKRRDVRFACIAGDSWAIHFTHWARCTKTDEKDGIPVRITADPNRDQSAPVILGSKNVVAIEQQR